MENINIWENCRLNLLTLRNFYGLTQQQVADSANLTLSKYRYAETINPCGCFRDLFNFWYNKALISADELLIIRMNEKYLKNREKRIVKNFIKFLNNDNS